ncbi:PREDICTED: protein FAM162A-like [Pygoscelis adeliae]|uniref:protein FAM162A-like n=1 Tax=Pygoscelis adeliae TaxID=9238 RepID=UPI0004F4D5D2|nr:PREDICTED: protein FAM162A-like [Pygoscelis adeliae]
MKLDLGSHPTFQPTELKPWECCALETLERSDGFLGWESAGYKVFKNDRRPTNFDKKVLVWAGRFKKEEDIPKHVSSEVLDAARNSVRIKVCYIMIALTLLGCLAMVITGKEAAKRDHTLLRMNTEKKAQWRAEVEKDGAAVGKPQ